MIRLHWSNVLENYWSSNRNFGCALLLVLIRIVFVIKESIVRNRWWSLTTVSVSENNWIRFSICLKYNNCNLEEVLRWRGGTLRMNMLITDWPLDDITLPTPGPNKWNFLTLASYINYHITLVWPAHEWHKLNTVTNRSACFVIIQIWWRELVSCCGG